MKISQRIVVWWRKRVKILNPRAYTTQLFIRYLFKEFYSSPVMKRIKATTRLTVGRVKP